MVCTSMSGLHSVCALSERFSIENNRKINFKHFFLLLFLVSQPSYSDYINGKKSFKRWFVIFRSFALRKFAHSKRIIYDFVFFLLIVSPSSKPGKNGFFCMELKIDKRLYFTAYKPFIYFPVVIRFVWMKPKLNGRLGWMKQVNWCVFANEKKKKKKN